MRFIWSLIGIAIGVSLIWKTFVIVQFFGKSSWAEKTFSSGLGGTYFFVKLFGLAVIALSLMYMFGIIDNIFPTSGALRGLTPQ